jgi:hypothetical protein
MTSEAVPATPEEPDPGDRRVRVTLEKHPTLWALCRTKFRSKRLADLQSGDMDRVLRALAGIIVEHNLPDAEDPAEIATDIGDVDYLLLGEVAAGLTVELRALPNR